MVIGVIGMGVVGSAVHKGFSQHFQMKAYDTNGKYDKMEDMYKCDIVFICTPTPTIPNGRQENASVKVTLGILEANRFAGVAVVKSTVLPGFCSMQAHEHKWLKLVHNPEFLTAATPFEDFMAQKNVLLSGKKEDTQKVAETYKTVFPEIVPLMSEKYEDTELAKYLHNTFLATKVAFFNEFYDLCQLRGANFEAVREMALQQERILPNHTKVPGPDGDRGFGGMCFPKDTLALSHVSPNMTILKAAIDSNNKIRDGKK